MPPSRKSGDVNADGRVNLVDLNLLAMAWNATAGSSNWNSNADLNGDGKVAIGDLNILARNWGR